MAEPLQRTPESIGRLSPYAQGVVRLAALRFEPNRARILDEWIEAAIRQPSRQCAQVDGGIRRWIYAGSQRRFLRVVPPGGMTVQNAFFDRGFSK